MRHGLGTPYHIYMYGVYTQHRHTKTETHHYTIVSRLVSLCVCVQSYHRHCGEKEKRTHPLARYRCFVQGFLVSLRSLRDAKKKMNRGFRSKMGSLVPGHQGTKPWALVPGHFFIFYFFYFGGSSFFSIKKNIVFSLFFLSFSLSFSLSLYTHSGFFWV